MNKLFIVRHGETDWNKKGLVQGKIDISLNETGIKQAKEIKNKININDIDVCFTSPLKRAMETAKIITNGKLDLIIEDQIIERGFGSLDGKYYNQDAIVKSWNYVLNYSEYKMETIKEVLKRAKEFLNYLNITYDNKNILIVSHGAFIKALYFNIIGYTENTNFLSFFPSNGEVLELEI